MSGTARTSATMEARTAVTWSSRTFVPYRWRFAGAATSPVLRSVTSGR